MEKITLYVSSYRPVIFSLFSGSQEHILEFFDDQFFVSVNFALCPDMKLGSAFFWTEPDMNSGSNAFMRQLYTARQEMSTGNVDNTSRLLHQGSASYSFLYRSINCSKQLHCPRTESEGYDSLTPETWWFNIISMCQKFWWFNIIQVGCAVHLRFYGQDMKHLTVHILECTWWSSKTEKPV
jgi:hypothetical protein